MGYQPKRKRYHLVFETSDYDGLEVVMGSLTTSEFLDIVALADKVSTADGVAAVGSLLEATARHLISWNVDDENGNRVPATVDGLMAQDLDFVLAIVTHWQQAIGSVPVPLPASSEPTGRPLNGSGQFPEVSLPMETLSPSRLSHSS